MKSIVVHGTAIYVQDMSNQLELIAVAPTSDKADWLAWSLSRTHAVDVDRPDGLPSMRYADR